MVGTGPDLNSATDNGLARAAELLDMSVPEVGVVQVTLRAPAERLERSGLLAYAREQSANGTS